MTDYQKQLGQQVGARTISDVICKCGHGIRDHRILNVDPEVRKASRKRKSDNQPSNPGTCIECRCNVFRFRRYHYKKDSSK